MTKPIRSIAHWSLVSPANSFETMPERMPLDGFAPLAAMFVIALARLAAYAWGPAAWGTEESIALAFALAAGSLLWQYVPARPPAR